MIKIRAEANKYLLLPAILLVVSLAVFFSPLRVLLIPDFHVYHTFLEGFCIIISLMIFVTQFVL